MGDQCSKCRCKDEDYSEFSNMDTVVYLIITIKSEIQSRKKNKIDRDSRGPAPVQMPSGNKKSLERNVSLFIEN